jgi:predicted SAM-dependent methyltransferase
MLSGCGRIGKEWIKQQAGEVIPMFSARFYDLIRSLLTPSNRINLAKRYIRGKGIEIGALHRPLLVPKGAIVKYVDRLPVNLLRQQYPELKRFNLVSVDIIDDGEKLNSIESQSQDFVIANHFLEHCEDPIGALEAHFRVLRRGGVLYLAIPDKRYIFDVDRPTTTFSHLLRDYSDGPDWSREQHLREWAQFVNKKLGRELEDEIKRLMDINYSIHFHVWTRTEILELLVRLKQELNFPFEVEEFCVGDNSECICILKKI